MCACFFSGKACKTVFKAAGCEAEVQRRLEPQRETALLSQTRTVASGCWNKRGGDQGTCILFYVHACISKEKKIDALLLFKTWLLHLKTTVPKPHPHPPGFLHTCMLKFLKS